MGRWTYIRLKCRGQRHVTIITAHQPCKGKPKPDGSMTVINQHYSILLQQKAKKPEQVQRHFVKDLSTFLHLRKTLGDEIIIAGDFNEDIGADSTGMSKICQQYHLADAIYQNHGNPQTQFATWIDGYTTLDYILVDVTKAYSPVSTHADMNPSNNASKETTAECSLTSTLPNSLGHQTPN
jgi:endonuclease/exonuclease/phosphatase family metal-dependent hydrolase